MVIYLNFYKWKKLKRQPTFLQVKGFASADVGVILGTGLGNFVKNVEVLAEVPYDTIPHFPVATVESHRGRLVLGRVGEKRVVIMQGRFHYYEGYSMKEVVFPVYVMKMLGISCLLISNAAGSINPSFKKGQLMMIEDHINLQPDNPLRGANNPMGDRFPDMSQPYSKQLNGLILDAANRLSVAMNRGVYASVAGPNLETRAEYRFLKTIGADAVGMSTVPEVIACAHMKFPCSAISVITDECDPDNLYPVSLQDILRVAAAAEKDLISILLYVIGQL